MNSLDKIAILGFPTIISAANTETEINILLPKEYQKVLGFTFTAAEQGFYTAVKSAYFSDHFRYDGQVLIIGKDVPLRLFMAEQICPECMAYPYCIENFEGRALTGKVVLTDTSATYPVKLVTVIHFGDRINRLINQKPCP